MGRVWVLKTQLITGSSRVLVLCIPAPNPTYIDILYFKKKNLKTLTINTKLSLTLILISHSHHSLLSLNYLPLPHFHSQLLPPPSSTSFCVGVKGQMKVFFFFNVFGLYLGFLYLGF